MKKLVPVGLLLLILLAGCRSRLNVEKTVSVTLMDKQWQQVDPISKEQTIKVAATAASGTFNIYLYLEKDKTDVEKAIDSNKASPKILAKEEKTTKADLSATIPANERGTILVMSGDGKKAEVKLKINN